MSRWRVCCLSFFLNISILALEYKSSSVGGGGLEGAFFLMICLGGGNGCFTIIFLGGGSYSTSSSLSSSGSGSGLGLGGGLAFGFSLTGSGSLTGSAFFLVSRIILTASSRCFSLSIFSLCFS